MKSSFKLRATAMLASVATTIVLLHLVASLGHPAVAPVPPAHHVADGTGTGGAS